MLAYSGANLSRKNGRRCQRSGETKVIVRGRQRKGDDNGMKWDEEERAGGCERRESREKREHERAGQKEETYGGEVKKGKKRKGGKRTQKRTKSCRARGVDEKRHQTGVRG